MDNCKGVNTPCDKFTDSKDDDELIDSKLYRSAVGSLVYAMVATRPDLSWSVSKLSQYLAKPTVGHWNAINPRRPKHRNIAHKNYFFIKFHLF